MAIEFYEDTDDEASNITQKDFQGIVSYNTDWTVETLISQLKDSTFNLDPSFQRRDAWTIQRKSKFIESLILGMPVPQITLAEDVQGSESSYIVLDGKQRLLSLLQFTGNADKSKNNNFKLTSLEILSGLNKSNYEQLKNNHPMECKRFLNYAVRTVVIRNWKDKDVLHSIFYRLNSTSVALSTQELRQVLYIGDFTDYLFEFTEKCEALKMLFQSSEADYRMRDVELALRYVAFNTMLSKYKGSLNEFLNDCMEYNNRNWNVVKKEIVALLDSLEDTLSFLFEVFGVACVARRWFDDKYGSTLNKAILDVLLFCFHDVSVRKEFASKAKKHALEQSYLGMFEDHNFIDSVSSTTKSPSNIHYRLEAFSKMLKKKFKIRVAVPDLDAAGRKFLNA